MKRFIAILGICALSFGLSGQAAAQTKFRQQPTQADPNQVAPIFNSHPYRYVKPVAVQLGLKKSTYSTVCTKDGVEIANDGRPEARCEDFVGRDGQTYRLVVMNLRKEPVMIAKMQGGAPLPQYGFTTDGAYAMSGAPPIAGVPEQNAPPAVAGRQPTPEDALKNLLGTILRGK